MDSILTIAEHIQNDPPPPPSASQRLCQHFLLVLPVQLQRCPQWALVVGMLDQARSLGIQLWPPKTYFDLPLSRDYVVPIPLIPKDDTNTGCLRPFHTRRANQVFCSPLCRNSYFGSARKFGVALIEARRSGEAWAAAALRRIQDQGK